MKNNQQSSPSKTGNSATSRRQFIKQAGMGGLAAGLTFKSFEDDVAHATRKVSRHSRPSDLKITDLRVATVRDAPMRCPLIRIDTNQGVVGWGEVRDGASERYALFLKSRILGQDPCNVEMIFKQLKQFGHHGRQGGGVSGIEMALWDLAGKAYDVPVYQMLGGKYRDHVRLYCDTTQSRDPEVYGQRMRKRVDEGFTFLKMDFGIGLLNDIEGTVVNGSYWNTAQQWDDKARSYGATKHPFTRVQITDKGLDIMGSYVSAVREAVGYETPLAADHFGHFGVNACIRLGKAVEKYQLAWLEDLVPWQYTEMWREITEAIDVPTLTGEDIFGREAFARLVDARAVDLIQPDLATAGGILETKRIGDYAEEGGVAMAMHFAGTPISFMANVHCAAATENFVALEHHSVDVDWWEDLVVTADGPFVDGGFAIVPNAPGLGIDLNEDVVKEHLHEDSSFFAPTPEWDEDRSWDRLWS